MSRTHATTLSGCLGYLSAAPTVSTRPGAASAGPRAHILGTINGFRAAGWEVRPYIAGDRLPPGVGNGRVQRLLERVGFRVLLAKDGLDAMEKLSADELPSVVLSDIEMPRMDGFDLVRNMRADSRLAGLPVIMITSRIAQKHRDYAAQLGVDHYLGKPYDEEHLLGLIRQFTQAAVVV